MRKPEEKPTAASARPAVEAGWEALRAHLLAQRETVRAAIQDYPAPIPACDAQFNYLLEQRDRLAEELSRLDALRAERANDPAALQAFLAASAFIDAEAAARIASRA